MIIQLYITFENSNPLLVNRNVLTSLACILSSSIGKAGSLTTYLSMSAIISVFKLPCTNINNTRPLALYHPIFIGTRCKSKIISWPLIHSKHNDSKSKMMAAVLQTLSPKLNYNNNQRWNSWTAGGSLGGSFVGCFVLSSRTLSWTQSIDFRTSWCIDFHDIYRSVCLTPSFSLMYSSWLEK